MKHKKIRINDTGTLLTKENSHDGLIAALPESERTITSRYGYRISCRDYSGAWLSEIRIPTEAAQVIVVQTAPFFSGISEFDMVTSLLLSHLIKSYDPKTVNNYGKGIWLVTSRLIQGEAIQSAVLNAIPDIKTASDLTAIKRLCRYFLMAETDSYSYDFHQEVQALEFGHAQNSYMKYYFLYL